MALPDGGRLYVFDAISQPDRLLSIRPAVDGIEGMPHPEPATLAARVQRVNGLDPLAAKRAKQATAKAEADPAGKAVTFRQCAEANIAGHRAGWKNSKHAAQWPSTLETYVYPIMGTLPVASIDTALVMKAIEPIWTVKPETASRVRGRIEGVLDWAATRGNRQGDNPARWRGHLENLLPKRSKVAAVEHHAILPYGELPVFMRDLRARPGLAARCLEFVILTAARTGEAIGATWPQIDEEARLWCIPGARMKRPGSSRSAQRSCCGDPRGIGAHRRQGVREFATTAAEMRVVSDRGAALENLVRRTGLEMLRGITSTLTQAIRFGTPLVESLRVLAAEMCAARLTIAGSHGHVLEILP